MNDYTFIIETGDDVYVAGDVWETSTGEVQILWMRQDGMHPVHTTDGKFLGLRDLIKLTHRINYPTKESI